jgi:hypothetical protein
MSSSALSSTSTTSSTSSTTTPPPVLQTAGSGATTTDPHLSLITHEPEDLELFDEDDDEWHKPWNKSSMKDSTYSTHTFLSLLFVKKNTSFAPSFLLSFLALCVVFSSRVATSRRAQYGLHHSLQTCHVQCIGCMARLSASLASLTGRCPPRQKSSCSIHRRTSGSQACQSTRKG